MPTIRFRSVIEAATGGGAAAQIPLDLGAELGGLKQMRVTGTLNNMPIRTSTMPYRGGFYVGLHKAAREAAGVEIGDEVELELTQRLAAHPGSAGGAGGGFHKRADASRAIRRPLVQPSARPGGAYR